MNTKVLTIDDKEQKDSIKRKQKVQSEIDKLDIFILTTNLPIPDIHKMLDKSFKSYFESFDLIH